MTLSAHKTLPAYSQGSIVAARTGRLDAARLQRSFDATATTSPAGSILATVDAARALLASDVGETLLGRMESLVRVARDRLRAELTGVLLPGQDDFPAGRFDPAKLVLALAGRAPSGVALESGLLAAGLPVELANRDLLVPIVTMVDDDETIGRLCDALVHQAASAPPATRPRRHSTWSTPLPPRAVSPRAAFFADREIVDAPRAIGRISAEIVAPYPPGIPVLVPGELITSDTLDALSDAVGTGVRIAYASDPTLQTWEVLRE